MRRGTRPPKPVPHRNHPSTWCRSVKESTGPIAFFSFWFCSIIFVFFFLVSFSPPPHTKRTCRFRHLGIPSLPSPPSLTTSASQSGPSHSFVLPATYTPHPNKQCVYVRAYVCNVYVKPKPRAPVQLKRNGAKYIKSAFQPTDGPSELIQPTKQAGPGR